MDRLESPPTPASTSTTSEAFNWINSSAHSLHVQDVAIIGMSCRTAGGNDTPEKLWNYLMEKKNASGEVPKHRWEPWLRRDPRNAKIIEKTISKGYFIDNLEYFDAAFFGISPKEAENMDPHQRLALELAWESLENAGIDPLKLAGSDTAVFMGVDSDDYSRLIMEDLPNIEAWSGIGTAYHGIPNRISYHLDLMGPSTAIDAACASSLVAIHLGRQAILSGESKVALCGGVNVLCAPGLTYMLGKAGTLSSDGICLSFDDEAHGYARGEGGAIIVLKKLSSAIADDDNILAVLKGSATGQDGKTNGIMAPNAKAQEMVARQALARAGGIDPTTIGYVEAHATSTSLGDPIEIGAIAKVYGVNRSCQSPCAIGSIKPNIGHLEAAAGAIGFVKTVLAVNKGELAPQTLLNKLNTRINWNDSGLKVVQERSQWPGIPGLRKAAICSYGYGGSVSHAIIEQADPAYITASTKKKAEGNREKFVSLLLSSRQEKRLPGHAAALAEWLSMEGRTENLKAISSTLMQRRAAHSYRAAFIVSSHEEAIKTLQDFANGYSSRWATSSRILGDDTKKDVVWVFSGHGAQWPDMGNELLDNIVFRESVAALDSVIKEEAGFSALTAFETGDMDRSDRVQILTYVAQVGLTTLLKSRGIQPQAIIGHSVGEISASVAAECLTPEEGAIIVSRRSKLYAQIQGQGGMALITLPFAQIQEELRTTEGVVAAINCSPLSCVVSGEFQALEDYLSTLKARGIKTHRVNTDIAFHSPMVQEFIDPLINVLSGAIHPRPATIPIYSTSNADPRTTNLRGVDYWIDNMVHPVRLTEAVEAALDDGLRVFLEVSTHPIITHSINETLETRRIQKSTVAGIMNRDMPAERTILHAISQLHNLGCLVDFQAQLGATDWATTVPNTPWVRKPYYKKVETGVIGTSLYHDADKHTLLGRCTEVGGIDIHVYATYVDDSTKPYPLKHPLGGIEIVPAAVYCNTFRSATGATILHDLQLRIPIPITAEKREVQAVVHSDSVRLSSSLFSSTVMPNGSQHPWINHSSCKFSKSNMATFRKSYDLLSLKNRIGTLLPNSFAWDFLQKIGVPSIAYPWVVVEHYGNEKEMIAKIDINPGSDSFNWDPWSWAPFIDAATSLGSSIFFKRPKMRMVSSIKQVQFVSDGVPPKIGYLYIEDISDEKSLAAHISILNEQGDLLVKVHCMRFSDVGVTSEQRTGADALVHKLAWVPPNFSETPLALDHVLLVSTDNELSNSYARILRPLAHILVQVESTEEFNKSNVLNVLSKKDAIVVYLPERIDTLNDVPAKAHAFTWETASILKILSTIHTSPKLFVITDNVYKGESPTALAQSPLYGFARIAAQEHPELWGGLIDNEGLQSPLLALKYVQKQDTIRMQDGLPRVARMRPFTKDDRNDIGLNRTLLPKQNGTYIVTGGLGDLGVEVLQFLVEKGACRIVIVARRSLPPRREWAAVLGQMKKAINHIQELEEKGITVYAIALDIGAPNAHDEILAALDRLDLPPVKGIIHAAGVSEDGLIRDTTSDSFTRVFNPKVSGALSLHRAFPPNTLDFFILFSSIGQLVGTPGQSPYGAANAFLDSLATYRRRRGDNAIVFQWTAWRGMGMAAGCNFLTEELNSKGITDISCEEAFQAWEHLSKYDTDQAVITRTRLLDADEPIPHPLVLEVAPRRPSSAQTTASSSNTMLQISKPSTGPELKDWLGRKIRECIGAVLHLDIEEIDAQAAFVDLGVDSVMTVALRQKLQSVMNVEVPPTVTWNHPTVGHLVEWFYGRETGE